MNLPCCEHDDDDFISPSISAVSYTHLDVYKRQVSDNEQYFYEQDTSRYKIKVPQSYGSLCIVLRVSIMDNNQERGQ